MKPTADTLTREQIDAWVFAGSRGQATSRDLCIALGEPLPPTMRQWTADEIHEARGRIAETICARIALGESVTDDQIQAMARECAAIMAVAPEGTDRHSDAHRTWHRCNRALGRGGYERCEISRGTVAEAYVEEPAV